MTDIIVSAREAAEMERLNARLKCHIDRLNIVGWAEAMSYLLGPARFGILGTAKDINLIVVRRVREEASDEQGEAGRPELSEPRDLPVVPGESDLPGAEGSCRGEGGAEGGSAP